jgi:hypothetical protein
MLQHTAGRAEVTTPQELLETDLERVVAGKDGNYGWFSILSGKEALENARRHPSPEIDSDGHIK